jgi:hypothetical protein
MRREAPHSLLPNNQPALLMFASIVSVYTEITATLAFCQQLVWVLVGDSKELAQLASRLARLASDRCRSGFILEP